MKQNRYDDQDFFERYCRMPRSTGGLEAAGEWHELRKMLPDMRGKRVLDLGCGLGWHCRYAAGQGAASVVGVDISQNMLDEAKAKTESPAIAYIHAAIEDFDYEPEAFDVVVSSLALHYVEPFHAVCANIYRCLVPAGCFVFSVEHPVFTADGPQRWCCDNAGRRLHWPVDRYFEEGARDAEFLGASVVKYHRTLTTCVEALLACGFKIVALTEPQPSETLLAKVPEMQDERRRPMMLILSAEK